MDYEKKYNLIQLYAKSKCIEEFLVNAELQFNLSPKSWYGIIFRLMNLSLNNFKLYDLLCLFSSFLLFIVSFILILFLTGRFSLALIFTILIVNIISTIYKIFVQFEIDHIKSMLTRLKNY